MWTAVRVESDKIIKYILIIETWYAKGGMSLNVYMYVNQYHKEEYINNK